MVAPLQTHDREVVAVAAALGPDFGSRTALLVRRAIDEIIATGRTRRWSLDQCNNQEKAYLGVNIENILRADFGFAPGRRGMDFEIEGVDVDCKWSRNFGGWQIPLEAIGHVCLLVYGEDTAEEIAVGLVRIHDEILVGGNRDKKRTLQSPGGLEQVYWLARRGSPLPENFLMGLRKVDRDAILETAGGDSRARELFMRCEGRIIERHTIAAVGQQLDDARRFRGETKKMLAEAGFEVLNGHWKADRARALELGGPVPRSSREWICLRTDGTTPARLAVSEPIRRAEAAEFRRAYKAEISAKRRRRAPRPLDDSTIKLALELQAEDDEAIDAGQSLVEAQASAMIAAARLF